ncbi:MAG TPA: cation-efflux pump [Aggregatilineales bacterium]|nr:cation-efflux pump [Aggregatilineales bacterium]
MNQASMENPSRQPNKAESDASENKVRYRQVRGVLWRVLVLNLLIALIKVFVGLMGGILAMVADGFHSAMDTSSNFVGIAAVTLAGRPPDDSHPYGHRRFETMATLTIGVLLLVAAWEILKEAVGRLSSGSPAVVTPLSFAVMLATMTINLGVTLYEASRGKRLHSDVLLADSAEHRVDIVIALSVLVGLAATALGYPWMDTIIALVIVGLIVWTAFTILYKTTQVLVDAAPVDPAKIRSIIQDVPGVDNILRVRSRGPADTILADIDVQVEPATTTERASAIASEIAARVKSKVGGVSEVQVHFAPHHDGPQNSTLVARAAADALGLSIHEVTEILTSQGVILEMHVEVPPSLTLAVAHRDVTELERRVRAALPGVNDVITHIEPASGQPGAVMQTARAVAQRDQALAIAVALYPDAHWHDATIRPVMGGYAMTIHCWLPGEVSVQEAHAIAEHVETQIRAALPQIQRVTIHTEPPEE